MPKNKFTILVFTNYLILKKRFMKTIYTFGISLFALILFSCNAQKANNNAEKLDSVNTATADTTRNGPIIGGNKDEHGCLIAAGYSWSILKQDCIRQFDLKTRLKDLQNSNFAGYLLFSEDNKQVEVFGIEFKPSIVLDIDSSDTYLSKDKKYKMAKDAQNHWLVSKTEDGNTIPILEQQ